MATLQDILGGGLPPGLLTPEQEVAAAQRAQNAGLLNFAFGALQASRGQPGQRAPSLAQVIGQAGPVGVAGYQQSFDQTLANTLRGMQAQQLAEQQRREKAFQSAIQNAYSMAPSVQGVMQTQTNIDPALLEGMSAEQVIAAAPKTERVLDQDKFMSALAQYSPLEYAKMAFKGSDETSQIKTLRSLISNPTLMEAFLKIEGAKAPRTTVSVDTKRNEAMFKEIDIPIVQGFVNSASSAREFANTSEQVNRLLQGAGGGKAVQVTTDLARLLGVNPGQVAADDLSRSLATQAAVKVRPPGSGSTSNIEFEAYIKSVPSLANSESGRNLMAKYSRAFAERSAKLADYSRKLAKDDKLSFEAIQAYDQSLGPILKNDFYNFAGSVTQPGVVDLRKTR